jgi:hypothetical protein
LGKDKEDTTTERKSQGVSVLLGLLQILPLKVVLRGLTGGEAALHQNGALHDRIGAKVEDGPAALAVIDDDVLSVGHIRKYNQLLKKV